MRLLNGNFSVFFFIPTFPCNANSRGKKTRGNRLFFWSEAAFVRAAFYLLLFVNFKKIFSIKVKREKKKEVNDIFRSTVDAQKYKIERLPFVYFARLLSSIDWICCFNMVLLSGALALRNLLVVRHGKTRSFTRKHLPGLHEWQTLEFIAHVTELNFDVFSIDNICSIHASGDYFTHTAKTQGWDPHVIPNEVCSVCVRAGKLFEYKMRKINTHADRKSMSHPTTIRSITHTQIAFTLNILTSLNSCFYMLKAREALPFHSQPQQNESYSSTWLLHCALNMFEIAINTLHVRFWCEKTYYILSQSLWITMFIRWKKKE